MSKQEKKAQEEKDDTERLCERAERAMASISTGVYVLGDKAVPLLHDLVEALLNERSMRISAENAIAERIDMVDDWSDAALVAVDRAKHERDRAEQAETRLAELRPLVSAARNWAALGDEPSEHVAEAGKWIDEAYKALSDGTKRWGK